MKRMLVIDDDVNICKMVERIFLFAGEYEFQMAHDGKSGIQKFKDLNPQIVLLDVRMPGMDGIETLKEIKKLDPEVGVIMITALEDEVLAKKAILLGAYEYIVKPFSTEYIETVVRVKIMDYLD
ncbi:MAG: response regulator [Pseudomonadota bacterium]